MQNAALKIDLPSRHKCLIFWGIVTTIRVETLNRINVFKSSYLNIPENSGFAAELKYLVFR